MSDVVTLHPHRDKVLEIVGQVIGAPFAHRRRDPAARLDSDLCTDLAFDSLHFMSLAVEIEEEFHIEIPDVEVARWRRVSDVVASVERGTRARRPQLTTTE